MYQISYYSNSEKLQCEREQLNAKVVMDMLLSAKSAKIRNDKGLVMLIQKIDTPYLSDRYAVKMLVNAEVKDVTYCNYDHDVENMIGIFNQGGYNWCLRCA